MTQQRWQRLTDWPLTIAAVLFLVAYAWAIIVDVKGQTAIICGTIICITWAFFIVAYVVNLALAARRWRWFYTHIFDLLVVLLPLLRPLRLLRPVTVFTVLQGTAGAALRGRVIIYGVGASLLIVFIAALAVLGAERAAVDANIRTFGDSLWWAFATVTTVGYGDYVPVTFLGRVIAVGLMVGGIALVGVVTGTLASWLVEKVAKQGSGTSAATQRQVTDLAAQLARIEERLGRIQS